MVRALSNYKTLQMHSVFIYKGDYFWNKTHKDKGNRGFIITLRQEERRESESRNSI